MNNKPRQTSRVSRISNTSALGGILASLTLNENSKQTTRKKRIRLDQGENKKSDNRLESTSDCIHDRSKCMQTPECKSKGSDLTRPPHMIQIGIDENQSHPQMMSPLQSPIFQHDTSKFKGRMDRHDLNSEREFESSSSDSSSSTSSSDGSSRSNIQNQSETIEESRSSRQESIEKDEDDQDEEYSLDMDQESDDDSEEYVEQETESEDSDVFDSDGNSYIVEEEYVPYGRPIASNSMNENDQDSVEEEDVMQFSSSAYSDEVQDENDTNVGGSDTETEDGSVSDSCIQKSLQSKVALTNTSVDAKIQDDVSIQDNHDQDSFNDYDQNDYSRKRLNSLLLSQSTSMDKNTNSLQSNVSIMPSSSQRMRSTMKKGQWTLGTRIGQGSFGVVHVGMNKLNGTLMAVKSIVIPSGNRQLQEDIRREIDLMKSFEHKNIVKYLGCELDKERKILHIFQEWVPGGSVASLLRKFGPFPISVIRSYLYQILTGLKYLHSKNILHRDIKGGNVLVNDEGVVKLADFGASKCMECLEEDRLENMTMCGTPYFMAPEVFEENYGTKADVWACACVAYQMCTTNPPWKGLGIKSPIQLFRYITENDGPPPLTIPMPSEESEFKDQILEPTMNCSLANLMEQCFMRDSKQRPSVTQLMEHFFFQETEDADESILEDQSILGTVGPLSPISPSKIEEIKRSSKKIQKQWPEWAKPDNSMMKQFL